MRANIKLTCPVGITTSRYESTVSSENQITWPGPVQRRVRQATDADRPNTGTTPEGESAVSNAFENESSEHRWTREATTPFGIVGGCGLRGEDLIEGFTLLFETRDLVADVN